MFRMVNYDQKAILRHDECSRTQRPSDVVLVHYNFVNPRVQKGYPARNFLIGEDRRLSEAEDIVVYILCNRERGGSTIGVW